MRVAVLSYPMLFQTKGGLQVQVLETIAALRALHCDARLIDPNRDMLKSFDLVHVFSVINGNHRIVEQAKALGVPVVLSPLIRPQWNRALGRRASMGERVLGRLTEWEVKSEYRQMLSGLREADRLIALGEIERDSILAGFGVAAEKIEVIPNGIPQRFFSAGAENFLQWSRRPPGFVLNVASIDPHKNQLTLAAALSLTGVPSVLIGECHLPHRGYLQEILRHPGTWHAGSFDYEDERLPSAYAAAGVTCLPSKSEVMPLAILESLAAGTPAIVTKNHCMDLADMKPFVTEVDPDSPREIAEAVHYWLQNPPDGRACRQTVRALTWAAVGERILACYEQVLSVEGERTN